MEGMRNRWAALGGAALVILLAVAAWRIAGSGSGSAPAPVTAATGAATASPSAPAGEDTAQPPAPTASPRARASARTSTPRPEGSAAAPATPTEVGPPTASPAAGPTGGPPLAGSARRDDPAGDLSDSAGAPPPDPEASADLTAVELSGDGEQLLVTFTLAGDVPPQVGSLVWSLDLWVGQDLTHTVTVQQIGGRVVAGVLDWRSGEQVTPPDPPALSGRTVSLRVPGDLLTGIAGPFRWQAVAQVDGGYEDYVPADGVLDWFPETGP